MPTARTLRGRERTFSGSGRSLRREKRSFERWAVTQNDGTDTPHRPAVTPRSRAVTGSGSGLSKKEQNRRASKPFRFTAAGAAAEIRSYASRVRQKPSVKLPALPKEQKKRAGSDDSPGALAYSSTVAASDSVPSSVTAVIVRAASGRSPNVCVFRS
ncbi:hypothetical protein ALCH109712_09655 [Alkalicoccus chagannorensis]